MICYLWKWQIKLLFKTNVAFVVCVLMIQRIVDYTHPSGDLCHICLPTDGSGVLYICLF